MENHQYFKMFKPYGILSQFIDNSSNKKNMLGTLYDFPDGTMAIGRLDEKSEGLLLLSTDGKMSEKVRRKSVEKEYYVQLDGVITDEAIKKLQQGVKISIHGKPYMTLPSKAFKLNETPSLPSRSRKIRDDRHGPTSWASVTVTEGKFRQVRKMTAAVGFPTLRLVRVRVGNEMLEGLKIGDVKEVSDFDIIEKVL